MDGRDRPPVATFFSPEALVRPGPFGHPEDPERSGPRHPEDPERSEGDEGSLSMQTDPSPPAPGDRQSSRTITLGQDAARHARVRRLELGSRVRLVDGAGGTGEGKLIRIAKSQLVVEVTEVAGVEPPPPVHLLVPIADRDRMLWLAEKCAELGVTSWRPVLWKRSRSVSPRGERTGFQRRVRARMVAALEQSGGAWLPMLYPDARPGHAIAATPRDGARILLSTSGPPLLSIPMPQAADGDPAPVSIALGPEGGLEEEEIEALVTAGFAPASLAGGVLRFETAGIAAVAIVRAALAASGVGTRNGWR